MPKYRKELTDAKVGSSFPWPLYATAAERFCSPYVLAVKPRTGCTECFFCCDLHDTLASTTLSSMNLVLGSIQAEYLFLCVHDRVSGL